MDGGAVRPPERHELDAFASCVEAAFLLRFPAVERERFLAAIEPEGALVALDDALIVGTLASHLVELTLPGPVVAPARALTDIAVLPTHRRRGHLTAMLGRFLADAHTDGEALALLDASAGGLYGRFGFGPATWASRYRLESARAELRDAQASDALRLLSASEASSSLREVFELVRKASPGEITRGEPAWEVIFEADKHSEQARFFAVHVPGGVIDGYAIYDAFVVDHGFEVRVEELQSTSDEGYRALWLLLMGLDGATALQTGPRPHEEPARYLLRDPRALQQMEVRDRSWLRLVDVEMALSLRRYSLAGSLVIGVEDGLCPWNARTFELESDGEGNPEIRASSRAPELVLGASELAAIYLGGASVDSLIRAGRASERTEGAGARAGLRSSR